MIVMFMFNLRNLIFNSWNAMCGLRFATDDVLEVHHRDGNHANNTFDNLRLLHGRCHDFVHGQRR
jgi:hypothetical protein